jgi:hypothetical protein
MNKVSACLLVGVALAGCAGRKAVPVAVMQPYDNQLSCQQLQAEIASNETQALQLSGQNESAHSNNIAIGVVGAILFWPALFAIDTGDAEKVEMQALHDRNQHLSQVYTQQGCVQTKTAAAPASSATAPSAPATAAPPSGETLSPQVWASTPVQKACKLSTGKITVKTEDDCGAAGGQPAPF